MPLEYTLAVPEGSCLRSVSLLEAKSNFIPVVNTWPKLDRLPRSRPMDRYKITKQLGDGTYGERAIPRLPAAPGGGPHAARQQASTHHPARAGTVWKAINRKTGEVVAVKKMKRKYYSWEECLALREVKGLRRLHHPCIIKLKEVVRENDELFFVFEFMVRREMAGCELQADAAARELGFGHRLAPPLDAATGASWEITCPGERMAPPLHRIGWVLAVSSPTEAEQAALSCGAAVTFSTGTSGGRCHPVCGCRTATSTR